MKIAKLKYLFKGKKLNVGDLFLIKYKLALKYILSINYMQNYKINHLSSCN